MTLLHPLVFGLFPEDVDSDMEFSARLKSIQVRVTAVVLRGFTVL